ncbi:MAG TPA: hypothetical protein VF525_04655 [Pyrinomonadaceae bacterium]|jgi:asparagine N-glycosylation enzyme membrane subunit Stt3
MTHRLTALSVVFGMLFGLLSLSVLAQSSGNSGSSSQTTTTQTTRTTETAQPTTVQVTRTAERTGINPLWLGIGAVVLLAIVAIAAMGARGRSRDHTAVVHERETVIKRE